ncbi:MULTISPECIES: hypothetical protein [unclassified Psychrobacter]|uniref:hypothetical protein n=1 Tax=unclassified Psychrobacter TaxID=196806 RepID=UPI0025E13A6E|nr:MULTISPECIES: hypothetical protein [unclassified Psychrobacter]
MSAKNEKIAIISRSFWPENPAIGEALLLLAESLSKDAKPIVMTQVNKGFTKKLKNAGRGKDVKFLTLPALTDSSSPIVLRISELLLFTGFTFTSLVYHRPDKVYVATNPPVFTPLAVRWYCQLFDKKYVYHLQDIHPEITSIVTGKNNFLTRLLERIDTKTITKASTVITLTEQMQSYITKRTGKQLNIKLLSNPAVQDSNQAHNTNLERINGFVYCGNAGRLQRIPLLLDSIKRYIQEGGKLPFVFAGGGVYSDVIQELAAQYQNVSYLGVLPAHEASNLLHQYSFGLMPIEDEVTKYAFPSKSSSYIFSGCQVIAVCGKDTSVAEWVLTNNLGYIAEPHIESLVDLFHKLEKSSPSELNITAELLKELTPQSHADSLKIIMMQGE